MNFSNFTKISSGNLIYFRNEAPIENVGSIKFYKDNASGTFLKKEMRWSFDRNHWASWMDLNVGNIAGIKTGDNKYLFFEIKYTMTSPTAGKVSSFLIDYLLNSGQTYAPPVEDVNMDHGHTLPDGCNDLGGTTKTFEVIKITDAETLCGKSCDYYLWRGNHKGTQGISTIENLQNILNNLNVGITDSINNALNVDGSGAGTFFQKSGRNLIFKKIAAGPGAYIADASGIITIGVDASLSIHDPSINDLYNLFYQLESDLTDVSIYIDIKFASIDSSIIDLYARDASSIKSGINLGGGVGEIFKGIAGQEIQFRTIESISGGLDVSISADGNRVILSFDASVSGETLWKDSTPVSADVGGISGGYTVPYNSNSIDILDKILYEYFPPRVLLNLDPSPGYYEKWLPSSLSDVSVYGSFDNYDFVKVLIPDVSAYATLLGGFGHISYSPDVSEGVFSFNDGGFNSGWDDIVYTVKIYNKVGVTMMPTEDVSAEIKFVSPYIWGVTNNDISIGSSDASIFNILTEFYNSGQKLIVPKQSNMITYTSNHQKFVYAYPASYGTLNSIFDVKNDFNVTTSFESRDINFQYESSPAIPYKVYIKSHWIDVSSFNLIFNI